MLKKTLARLHWLRDLVDRSLIERHYRRNPPPIAHGAQKILIVEGLWDNPNHWLRLWIFLHAFLRHEPADVVGILRSADNWDNWKKRKSLESLGIRRFIYLEDEKDNSTSYLEEASSLLKGIDNAQGMLALKLPDDLPAYTYFDTVLKHELHPQPVIEGNPIWQKVLAELLRLGILYRRFFDANQVVGVVSSHAWKSEWASLCWTALRRRIPFFYMTAHYDSIRLRRMASVDDYRAPNEHLPFAEFAALPLEVRRQVVDRGRDYMNDRFNGNSDFIVMRYSLNPDQRGEPRQSVLEKLGLDPRKPLVVVYAHSWFDFPHTQALKNFTEPLDWIQRTLEVVLPLTDVNWAFKPHPCDRWYGAIRLESLLQGLPSHIAILPEDSDSLAIQSLADALVTIQGSIAIEGAAAGKIVLCADRGMNTDWGFTHVAQSREDYAAKLEHILDLDRPTTEQMDRALAFAATSLAPPPVGAGSLRLTCDTRFIEGALYPSLRTLLAEEKGLRREIGKVEEWLGSPSHSYNTWRTIDHLTSEMRVAQVA